MNVGSHSGGKVFFDWREDLAASRDLSRMEIDAYGYVLGWLESFRLRHGLAPGREAAKLWWNETTKAKERPEWQLRQWAEAVRWYLSWLEHCEVSGGDGRSVAERLKIAVHGAGARRGLALRTRQSYAGWVGRYGAFVDNVRGVMDLANAREFLSWLVTHEKVAFSTQKQALNALSFFFRAVCGLENPDLGVKLKKTAQRQPVVLNRRELMGLIDKLEDRYKTPALLQYGAGLRLKELVQLRIKDVDVTSGMVTVRAGKGDKDRVSVIPNCLKDSLVAEIARSREFWELDRLNGVPGVALPGALARKMPRAGAKWAWMWLFSSDHLSRDPLSGLMLRHHLQGKAYAEAIRRAAERAEIPKRVTSHALRHAFATDLLRSGTDIRTLQELLGHADVKTTEIYVHAAEIGNGKGVKSPLDAVAAG